ncbi:MAG: tripartite tricarboxylate transporter substrate binding protein [Thermodesulfobacteriota bacterium]
MKRHILWLSTLLLTFGLLADLKAPWAAPYPSRPIKVMVPAAASGSLGQEIRTIVPFLEKNLKASIMIDYVTGADGMIAYNKFQKEKPDGYSLLHFNLLAALPLELTRETAKYEVKAYSPVAVWNFKTQAFIVHPDNWKTFPEMLNEAKKRTVSLAGTGGHSVLNLRLMETGFGIKFNFVPYTSSAEGFAAVAGRHLDAVITYTGTPKPMVRAGKLRALAVLGSVRDPILPEIPSFNDLGFKDVAVLPNYGLLAAPPGTPKEIITVLEKAVGAAAADPEFNKLAENMGVPIGFRSSSDTVKFIREQYEIVGKYKEMLK